MTDSFITSVLLAYEKTGFSYQRSPSISLDLVGGGPLAVLAIHQKGPEFFRNKGVTCRKKCCFLSRGHYFQNWELMKWVPYHEISKPCFWKGMRTAIVWTSSKIFDLDYVQEAKDSWEEKTSKEMKIWLDKVYQGKNLPEPSCIQKVKDSFYEGLAIGYKLNTALLQKGMGSSKIDPIECLGLRKIEPLDEPYFNWLRNGE